MVVRSAGGAPPPPPGTAVAMPHSAPHPVSSVAWRVLDGHTGFVYALAAVGDRLYSGAGDATVRVWRCGADGALVSEGTLQGHSGAVFCLAGARDVYSGSQDAAVRVWDIETMHCKHVLLGHTADVLCLTLVGPAAAPDFLASGSADRTVRLWSTHTYRCMRLVDEHTDIVLGIASAGRMLMTASADNTMRALDMGDLLGGDAEEAGGRSDFFIDVSPPHAGAAAAAAAGAGAATASVVAPPRRVALSEASLLALLREFVAIRSVSQDVRACSCDLRCAVRCLHLCADIYSWLVRGLTFLQRDRRSDCWRAAKFVQVCAAAIPGFRALAHAHTTL